MDQVEVTVLLDELARVLAGALERRDGGGDDRGAGSGELRGDEGDAADVLVAVLAAEAKLRGELAAHGLAEEHGHGPAALLVQRDLQGTRDLVLAAVLVARQEDGEALLGPGRVRLAQDRDDLGVREPLGDIAAAAEPGAQLGSRDVERADALGDLVHGRVLVLVGQVGHHLEGHHLDPEARRGTSRPRTGRRRGRRNRRPCCSSRGRVVSADDEVRRTVVLADDGVPDGLAGAAHAHGQRQETENRHAVGVSRGRSAL